MAALGKNCTSVSVRFFDRTQTVDPTPNQIKYIEREKKEQIQPKKTLKMSMLNNNSSALLRMLATLLLLLGVALAIEVQKFGHLYNPPQSEHHAPRHEDKQDLNKIPGVAGVDYPIYHEVPHTQFSCHNVPAVPGMYANVETGCQAYHVCHDGREGHQGASFLCTNGTIFNQKEFACDWWYNVKCEEATSLYHLNADPEHNPYIPKKKPELELEHAVHDVHNGAGFLIHA